MEATYADLEIGLHRRDADHYQIELRFSRPDSDTDDRLARGTPVAMTIDWQELRSLQLDNAEYGKRLGEFVLGHQDVQTAFAQASRGQTIRAHGAYGRRGARTDRDP